MIKLRINLEGIGVVEFQGETRQELVEEAAFWSELPSHCPLCRAAVRLCHRIAQDFHFYGLKCRGKVSHESNFGTTKKSLRLFYKGPSSWREAYGATDEEVEEPQQYEETPASAPVVNGASRKPVEATSAPQQEKAVLSVEEAEAKFWELARRFGQTQAALSEAQTVDFLTALSDGAYPNRWDTNVWKRLAAPLFAFWKAACEGGPALKERGKIPTAFLSKCAQIEFGEECPGSTTAIRGEQWKLMADRLPHYLEVIEGEKEEVL